MPEASSKHDSSQAMAKLATKVMGDRKLLSILSEEVYKLMLNDLRHQRERN